MFIFLNNRRNVSHVCLPKITDFASIYRKLGSKIIQYKYCFKYTYFDWTNDNSNYIPESREFSRYSWCFRWSFMHLHIANHHIYKLDTKRNSSPCINKSIKNKWIYIIKSIIVILTIIITYPSKIKCCIIHLNTR